MAYKLLIIDEDAGMLKVLESTLEREYEVIALTSAANVLPLLKKGLADLVINDVTKPGMNGFDILQQIKADPETSHIPVILLTEPDSVLSEIKGMQLKADASIEKPFPSAHLVAQIKNLIDNRRVARDSLNRNPLLYRGRNTGSAAHRQFLEKLQDTIFSNLENEKLDVSVLAKNMNMSRISLYRRIRLLTNSSPAKLISNLRLQQAAKLLAEGEMRIYEIALAVGYSSQSNFTRVFQRTFKMTPSAFKYSVVIKKV